MTEKAMCHKLPHTGPGNVLLILAIINARMESRLFKAESSSGINEEQK